MIYNPFSLLEANLPRYAFLSMDSIMPICTPTLYNFDRVTDPEIKKNISGMNKTTCSSDPFPTRLLMSHIHATVPILQHIVNLCLTTGDLWLHSATETTHLHRVIGF